MLRGYDVSNHNAEGNWPGILDTLRTADFVWVRATEGNEFPGEPTGASVDPYRGRYVVDLKGHNVRIGLYHFAHPENNVQDEARWFLKYAQVTGSDQVALDFEPPGEVQTEWVQWVLDWVKVVSTETGKAVVLYTNESMMRGLLAAATAEQAASLRRIGWWKALWRDVEEGYGDDLGFVVVGWQWTDEPLDQNIWYTDPWSNVVPDTEEDDVETTANGWPMQADVPGPQFVAPNGQTPDVLSDDLAVIFAWKTYRWHTEIEDVTAVFGGRTYAQQMAVNPRSPTSNHVSFTADDTNGAEHPYEQPGVPWHSGFTAAGERKLREILDDCRVLQWGGDFPRPYRDAMHVQVRQDLDYLVRGPRVVSEDEVSKAARRIRTKVKRIQRAVGAKEDGYAGPGLLDAVRQWQKEHDLVVDGIFGPASQKEAGWKNIDDSINPGGRVVMRGDRGAEVRRVQRKVGVTVDGIFGPATERAVKRTQGYLNVKKDGQWGPATERAYRRFVDGDLGKKTIRLWQQILSVKRDGILGPITIKAIQRRVGVEPDGILGPVTRRAVQRHLRVKVDGIWGHDTNRALQKRLLQGRF